MDALNKLIWVYDSPFSRSIKWLLLHNDVPHEDHVLTWDEMATDPLLADNLKKQVPTIWNKGSMKTDSLLIALEYLPASWYQSVDAKLFRLADSDVEAAIIFLFRANLLKDKFGESENSRLMLKAGIDTYKQAVDYLLDHLVAKGGGQWHATTARYYCSRRYWRPSLWRQENCAVIEMPN